MKKIIIIIISILTISLLIFGGLAYYSLRYPHTDVHNIQIEGVVKNANTDKSITLKESDIQVKCWIYGDNRNGDPDYIDYKIVNLKTNGKGEFSVNFERGSFIVFTVKTEGFEKCIKSFYPKKSYNFVDIQLVPLN